MAVSTLTLAKRIKAMVQRHPELVERDGTQDVPKSFNFNFGGELEEAGETLRNLIRDAHNVVKDSIYFDMPSYEDESREANQKRYHIYAIRALYTLCNSPRGMLRTVFQNRNYSLDDISEATDLSHDVLQPMEGTSCFFQFKRIDKDENNPWTYSWMMAVDGVSVTRGSKQPIGKLVSALLKLLLNTELVNTNKIQTVLAELAKMKGGAKPYYWYLSNKHTAMYYHACETYLSLRSCMSKSYDFYNHCGARQHPMDCYDDSPDWSLMFLSEQSPEEIIAHCDLVIANPDAAEFKFPFLSRTLVLPATKEISGRNIETPYIFGKFYGNDKLVNFFYEDVSSSAVLHKNNNGLLSNVPKIDGGLIRAIPSSRESGVYLLPYFDKENKARLIVDPDGTTWWMSVGINKDVNEPVAKCSYEYGSAKFESFKSLAYGGHYSLSTYRLEMIDTMFGQDLAEFEHEYLNENINGIDVKIPKNMYITLEGRKVLKGDTTELYDGRRAITADIATNPERYKLIQSIGIFDMESADHFSVYARFEAAQQENTNG